MNLCADIRRPGIMFFPTLTAVLIYTALFAVMTRPVCSEGSQSSISSLAPKITELKLKLHHMLEGSRIRKKRQLFDNGFSDNQMRVGSAAAEYLPYLANYNLTFWIPVRHYSENQMLLGTEQGHLILYQLSDYDDKVANSVALSLEEEVAVKAKVFSYYDEQWFVVLHQQTGRTRLRMYVKFGRTLEGRQSIDLNGESDFDLVTIRRVQYLVVVTYQTSVSQGFTHQAKVVLYEWRQTQFDEIASRTSHGARSVACWALDGSLYMAVAQEVNDDGNYRVGSPIYIYNSKAENRLVLREVLSTYAPRKVLHFYVAGNRYVIFVGRDDAIIFWWTNDQFLPWQTIPETAGASDVYILSLPNGEVAIVITRMEEVLFLTLDSSGHYFVSWVLQFPEATLSSLHVMFSGKAYYALVRFATTMKYYPSVWRLTLDTFHMPTGSSLDALQECLKSVDEILVERQTELDVVNKDLDRIWTKDSNQTISTSVVVKGEILSPNESELMEIVIIADRSSPAEFLSSHVAEGTQQVKDLIESTWQNLGNAVLKSKFQEIRGAKHFSDSLFIPSLNLGSSDIDVTINGVQISKLDQYALKKAGDQMFLGEATVTNIYSGNVQLDRLNGIGSNDFLLLTGEHNVTGKLKFSDVHVANLGTETLNYIPVDNFVTTKSHQQIMDLKTMLTLKADVIDVHEQTNGEYLSEIQHKIVTIDGDDDVNGRVEFTSAIEVTGVFFLTGLINGAIDIAHLARESVTKNTAQDLKGPFISTVPQFIYGDMNIAGAINGIPLDQIMTISSNQVVSGDIAFISQLELYNNLVVDQINGLNLNENAVLKMKENQFVGGTKVFINDIYADFIDMTEFVTLDGVDPSLLLQDIVKHEQGVVKQDSTVFVNVIVQGNLSVSEGVNGRDVFDLESTTWRKSVEQTIDADFYMQLMTCKKDLESDIVNSLHLTDIVKSYGDKTVNSVKNFSSVVSIPQNFKTRNGVLINGQDLVSFERVVEDNTHQNIVHGTKILESFSVKGNLMTKDLNGWILPAELMKSNTYQAVAGPVTFLSELTVLSDSLKANTVSFHTLNSLDLEDFIRRAVTKAESNFMLLKNKKFAHLKADHVTLHNSTLNSISLSDMVKRAVTLNTPQSIPSDKSFLSSIGLEKSSFAIDVNGVEISSYSTNVVLKDKAAVISARKQFKRGFHVDNMLIGGYVNQIKIEDMNKNVFSKSEDNEIDSVFFFMDDIDVGNLVTGSLLDDVNWNDLIFLNQDEVLGPAWFLSDTHATADIFITGLLNGCDITDLGRRALYAKKPSQIFKEEMKIESIEVIGNVKIQSTINDIPIENLKEKLITLSGEQRVVSNVFIDSKFAVTNFHISDLLNFVNLSHIMQDAVMKTIPQEIDGHKKFISSLKTDVIVSNNVFLVKLNGINIEELEKMAVWKTGDQIIEGEKIFSSFFVHVVTFNAYLNGLVLPRDVVKTDTAEIITNPVFFVADLALNADLVGYSKIDGVNIDYLQNNRVTLSGKQSISSHLTFQQDVVVYEDVSVDGTVNEVVLELAVLTKNQVIPLEDYKIFIQDFDVADSMTASLVNGYDPNSLGYNILRKNKEEFVSNLQVFEKRLHAENSLIAEWINNISISKLTAKFWSVMYSLTNSLSYFTTLSHSVQQLLGIQMEKAANQASRFAYFILIQEIALGPVNKIMHGYRSEHVSSDLSHMVVLWTTRQLCKYTGRCCQADFSYWGKVKKSGEIMIDGEAQPGKFYPFQNFAPFTFDKGFFIWTNATDSQPKWCEDKHDEKMVMASFTESNSFNTFTFIRNAPLLSEIKSFRSGHLYAVAGFYYDKTDNEYSSAVVYGFDERLREWSEHQILPTYGVLSLDVTKYTYDNIQDILLAVGTGMDSYSSIYKWNEKEKAFELLQNLNSGYVTSTVWFQKGSIQMLGMAEVDEWPRKETNCLELARGGQINIYVYQNSLIWIQSIPLRGVISMVSFSLEDETYLVAASSEQQVVSVFQWKGYSRFTLIQSIFAAEVRHLNIYNIHNELFMTIASAFGPSKVLKLQIQGKYEKGPSYKIPSEVNEEPKDEAIVGC